MGATTFPDCSRRILTPTVALGLLALGNERGASSGLISGFGGSPKWYYTAPRSTVSLEFLQTSHTCLQSIIAGSKNVSSLQAMFYGSVVPDDFSTALTQAGATRGRRVT